MWNRRLEVVYKLSGKKYQRLYPNLVRVSRSDSYEKRPVLSATSHPDIKRTLVSISKRTGMTVSQVADEVLYTGLIEMQELPDLSE